MEWALVDKDGRIMANNGQRAVQACNSYRYMATNVERMTGATLGRLDRVIVHVDSKPIASYGANATNATSISDFQLVTNVTNDGMQSDQAYESASLATGSVVVQRNDEMCAATIADTFPRAMLEAETILNGWNL